MPRESKKARQARALEAVERIHEYYGDVGTALDFSNAFTLTIATALSAQTTDKAVNMVTPELFKRWPDAQTMAGADPNEIEGIIHSIGFYRTKARNCVACARMICTVFGGEVPSTMEDLITLPGVGRKTANIVLNHAFGIVEGIAVDTHVFRIAHMLRFSAAATPEKTELDLLALFPREMWKVVNSQWVRFGREICIARRPRCSECPLRDLCPSASSN